jgi:hypothetical protein
LPTFHEVGVQAIWCVDRVKADEQEYLVLLICSVPFVKRKGGSFLWVLLIKRLGDEENRIANVESERKRWFTGVQ